MFFNIFFALYRGFIDAHQKNALKPDITTAAQGKMTATL